MTWSAACTLAYKAYEDLSPNSINAKPSHQFMKPRHHLRCLGYPALFAPTGELIRIRTKKHLALLVYLAIESRRPHRRDDLAALLWPKAKPSEARHSLSTALSLFRARLGREAVEAGREKVSLVAGRLEIDVEALVNWELTDEQEMLPPALFGFLEGFDIADAPDFSHWKDRQQARLLLPTKEKIISLIESRRRTGDLLAQEALADRLLMLDELCEEGIRAKVEARAFLGDRITALRIYEQWRANLADEFHAEPAIALQRIATQLRRSNWHPNTTSTAQQSQEHKRPFIGRSSEYLALYEQWQKAMCGMGGHTYLIGDSGIGKTTLAQQIASSIALNGAATMRIQCYDIEQRIPYSTLNALILQLLDQPGASSTSQEALTELSSTSSEIRKRYPSLPRTRPDRGESARIRLAEAFVDLLLAIVDNQPLLLIVDDVHHADDASLAVLHLAMRRAPNQPIMFLFIGRPGAPRTFLHTAFFESTNATPQIRRIELGPLSQTENQELLNELLTRNSQQPSMPVHSAILRASSGYPMALELLTQDWIANGDRCVALSVNAMTEEPPAGGKATATYRQLIRNITRTLTPATRGALSIAAILGARLNDMEAYEFVGLEPNEASNALAELTELRLLRDNGRQLEFINELVRAASYIETPSPVRRHLHGAIVDRLIAAQSTSADKLDIEIAWHCLRSGRQIEAVAPLMRGAHDALRRGAPYLAEQVLTTALPILQEPQKRDAVLLLIEATQEQSKWDDSLTLLQGLKATDTAIQADLKYIFELTARKRLRQYEGPEQLTEFVNQIIQFIWTSQHNPSRLRAAVEGASALHVIRSSALTQQLLGAIARIPEDALNSHEQAQLFLAKAMSLFNLEDFPNSIRHIEQGIDVLQNAGVVDSTLAMLQSGLGSIYSLLGNYPESAVHLSAAASTATRIDNKRIYNLAAANLSVTYNRLGEYTKSIKWAEQAATYVHEVYSAAPQGALCSHAMLRDLDGVNNTIERWTPILKRHYSRGVVQGWNLLCADALFMLGHKTEAENRARATLGDEFIGPEAIFCAGAYARWVARIGFLDQAIEVAFEAIEKLCSKLTHYHRMDQAEILTARAWLGYKQNGRLHQQDREEIRLRLNELPRSVTDQLDRLGMLGWNRGSEFER